MPVGKATKFVIDSSFVLSFLLPDENESEVVQIFGQYTLGEIELVAPTLLPYEVINGLKGAILRKRITLKEANVLINQFSDLTIMLKEISLNEVLGVAVNKNASVYDVTYLYLSKSQSLPLLTLDKKLQELS